MDTAHGPQLLTVYDVAEVLGIHHATVRRHMKSGELPAPIRIGSRLYLTRQDLDNFLESKRRTSA